MDKVQSVPLNGKLKSINQALQLLNEAAETSSDEIHTMIERDFEKFSNLLKLHKPTMNEIVTGIQQSASDSFAHTTEQVKAATKETVIKIDQAAHKNPWLIVGIAAILSGITGYIFANKIRR